MTTITRIFLVGTITAIVCLLGARAVFRCQESFTAPDKSGEIHGITYKNTPFGQIITQ